jgi:hypothetical protein
VVNDLEPQRAQDIEHEPWLDPATPDTVGTGSVIAVGCIAAVVLLVLLALVVRWIAGGW